jgi:hypothetical protein
MMPSHQTARLALPENYLQLMTVRSCELAKIDEKIQVKKEGYE